MQTPTYPRYETRRIILLRRLSGRNTEVLLGREGTDSVLPEVQIAHSQRIAEQLTSAVREMCGIDSVYMSSLEGTQSCAEHIVCEIMESTSTPEKASPGKCWVSVNSLIEDGFHDHNDLHAIGRAIEQSTNSETCSSFGSFAHIGWFDELKLWTQEEIRHHGLHLTGSFRQLNGSPTFSLIRFETDGAAVWFKAVGVPNEREFALTLSLAHSLPRFLPQIISSRPACNGWLSVEVEGHRLDETSDSVAWKLAASDLAELQINSFDKCEHLSALGARDLRTSTLSDCVEPFFQIMCEVMERQPRTPPQRLTVKQLRVLSEQIQNAILLLAQTGVPETLGHMDLNPGNIVCSPCGSVFLDWAEAFVGHPFLTFGYLLEHFWRTFGRDNPQEEQFIDKYVLPWRISASEASIARALDFTPFLAVFAYAAVKTWWKNPETLSEPQAGYLRSLTRRMEREASRLAERRVLCQPS